MEQWVQQSVTPPRADPMRGEAETGAHHPIGADIEDPSQQADLDLHQAQEATATDVTAIENLLAPIIGALSRWLQQSLPFFALFLTAFISHHFIGILVFVWLTWGLYKANQLLKNQLELWGACQLQTLALLATLLVGNTVLVYSLFASSKLWRRLVLLPTTAEDFGFWAGVWAVSTTDLMIKYGAMLTKVLLLVMIHQEDLPKSRRTQFMSLIEGMSVLYRSLAPVPVWLHFFSMGDSSVVSSVCTALYITLKVVFTWERFKCLISETKSTCQGSLAYGSLVQLDPLAEDCPICQSELVLPVQLHCGHLFCEACVSVWLDKETSCPLCRATVRQTYSDGWHTDGSTSLLPQLF
eukprot:TRINITY_DN8823_c0_g1_i1.p1 TRINITY_DN8823_c0_g1~~TRINITY_DN8823_c0_g1_i1.p1  ORF type:complete len:353 (+),score=44.55 TRINITY_DN8823_c0_g1_i1:189-1247(+)